MQANLLDDLPGPGACPLISEKCNGSILGLSTNHFIGGGAIRSRRLALYPIPFQDIHAIADGDYLRKAILIDDFIPA
jgi:hypothetical protein